MARVLRATANLPAGKAGLKEAISKLDVLTLRQVLGRLYKNMIQGLIVRATEQWIGNAQNSIVTLRVNHAVPIFPLL